MTTSQEGVGSSPKKRAVSLRNSSNAPGLKIDGDFLVIGETNKYPIENSCATVSLDVAGGIRLKQLPWDVDLRIERDIMQDSRVIRLPQITIHKSSGNRAATFSMGEFQRSEWQGVLGLEAWAQLWERSIKVHPEFDARLYVLGVELDKSKVSTMLSMAFKCQTVYEAFIFTESILCKFEYESISLQRELIAKIGTIGVNTKAV